MILITKSSNPSHNYDTQSHQIHHKVNSYHIMDKSPCKNSHVVDTCLVGVAAATSWSGLVSMWTWSSIVTDRRMQKLNDIKHIVNWKDCYINGKNIKMTWERYTWPPGGEPNGGGGGGGGEQWTVTCQILVVPSFAIQVVMQVMSTKIMPNCSISCNEITQLTWSIACCCAKQAA
jgi:hypothetical protein